MRPLAHRALLAASWACTGVGIAAPPELDVIVVGAGQAGMAAAHRLAGAGLRIRVLEATGHVGGRTRNVDAVGGGFDVATDDVIEVGGTWFSPEHTAALGLCRELGIEVYNASFVDPGVSAAPVVGQKSAEEEDWPWWFWGSDYPRDQTRLLKSSVFHAGNSTFRFRRPAELRGQMDPRLLRDLDAAGALIEEAKARLGGGCWNGTLAPDAWRSFDEDSTAGFLASRLLHPEGRQILRSCIHGHNAMEPEAVSFLYNLLSFRGCNSGGPDSQYRVRGGTQAIPIAVAAHLGQENISLSSPVQVIRSEKLGIHVTTRGGREFRSKVMVLTGPPPAILGIYFEPPLPAPHAQLLQRMPMGTSLKLAVVYKEGPWWRDLGLQGDVLSNGLPRELSLPSPYDDVPLFVQCMDHSPFSRRVGVIVCFLEGRQNLHFTSLSAERQRQLVTSFLRRSFQDARAETLEPRIIAHDWAAEPFARGAYTGFFPPGALSEPAFWEAYREMEKLPNVFLAGADYHTGFGNGYIEGAIRSGQRAAARVLARLDKRRRGDVTVARVLQV